MKMGLLPTTHFRSPRLRRATAEFIEQIGEFAFRAMYGNSPWGNYILIGKLDTRSYVLQRPS